MGFLDYKGLERFLKNSREEFAQKSHTHDERYYTEYEIDNKLSKKSDIDHIHDDRFILKGFQIVDQFLIHFYTAQRVWRFRINKTPYFILELKLTPNLNSFIVPVYIAESQCKTLSHTNAKI